MAENPSKKKPRIRKVETVRERSEKATDVPAAPRRLRRTAGQAARPLKFAARVGRREYHPVRLPDNKVGRFMTKRRSFIPSYFKNSWIELRQVVWPSRKETIKLTLAVFTFAIIFGVVISVTDYGLDKLFRKLLLQ